MGDWQAVGEFGDWRFILWVGSVGQSIEVMARTRRQTSDDVMTDAA